MKKAILLFFILTIIVGILGMKVAPALYDYYSLLFKDTRMPKDELFDFVKDNQTVLEDVVNYIQQFEKEYPDVIRLERAVNGQVYAKVGGQSIEITQPSLCQMFEERRVRRIVIYEHYFDFDCGGYGMGSAAGYAGFYYTRSGRIEDFDLVGRTKFEYDGKTRWTYKEPDGDNTVLIEYITGDFFYYFAEY